jgi:hypothetical protein
MKKCKIVGVSEKTGSVEESHSRKGGGKGGVGCGRWGQAVGGFVVI